MEDLISIVLTAVITCTVCELMRMLFDKLRRKKQMSSVNYSLKHKGVKLIPSEKAWVTGKNGKPILNPQYHFVGKINRIMPNLIISATDKGKPKYKGNTHDLCAPANKQIVEHFFNDKGDWSGRTKAYFGIEKKSKKKGKK